jgi:triosephosphate isomerase (TIM)
VSKKTRETIIAGNWKMHKTRHKAKELADAIISAVRQEKDLPEIVLCPTFTSLQEVCQAVHGSHVKVGAQNMDYRTQGAFTGEISPTMLTDLGVKYVIIGHSERRQLFGETNTSVNLKLKAALEHKLVPIVCVGETLDERDSGLTDSVVRRQIGAALADIPEADIQPLVVAYEPVWAIGTGKVCESAEANRVCQLIRHTITDFYEGTHASKKDEHTGDHVPVLYGGSVKASNIDDLMLYEDIDGALVGGASLAVEDFVPLIQSAQKRIKLLLSRV